jgi:hypothetical protein
VPVATVIKTAVKEFYFAYKNYAIAKLWFLTHVTQLWCWIHFSILNFNE